MANRQRIVIIGGVAAGPKAAARARRLDPHAEITIIERDRLLSYAGCGLPYYISGVVEDQRELMCTPVGVLRDPEFFAKAKDIRALNRTEAVAIDREAKEVEVLDRETGERQRIAYDKLVIATGAEPVDPPIPGADSKRVLQLKRIGDAERFRDALRRGTGLRVTIIGGGLIGMEMSEALSEADCSVTVIEMLPHILPMLDSDMALLVEEHLAGSGVTIMAATRVERIEDAGTDALSVATDRGDVPSDLVLMSVGVRPNVKLAREAGLALGPLGGIRVNEFLETSDSDVYAAGDCIEKHCFMRGEPGLVPMGSAANKEGRVVGSNVAGRRDRFPGVAGTVVLKVFDWNVGRSGLGETEAKALGIDAISVVVPGPDISHYYPGAQPIVVKLTVNRADRKLIGIQAVGSGDVAKRVDVAVTAMTAGMTVDQVAMLDLAYAPPYASAMDILITTADTARNVLDGLFEQVTPAEVQAMRERGDDFAILDTRSPDEYEQGRIPGATLVPLGALRTRVAEIPREKPVVALCKTSLRAYEASRCLQGRGFTNIKVMSGGMMAWPYEQDKS